MNSRALFGKVTGRGVREKKQAFFKRGHIPPINDIHQSVVQPIFANCIHSFPFNLFLPLLLGAALKNKMVIILSTNSMALLTPANQLLLLLYNNNAH